MSKTKGTLTNKSKLVGWDTDYYLSLSDEECLVCLTQKELYLLRNPLRQMEWSTRWESQIGTPNPDISDIAERLAFKLSGNDCIDFCSEVTECIENNEGTQDAIADAISSSTSIQNAINQYANNRPLTVSPDNNPQLTDDMLSSGCDLDLVYGQVTAIWNLIKAVTIDLLELLSAAGNIAESQAVIISAIPVIGLLPFDEIIEFVGKFSEWTLEAYNAALTVTLENEIKCDLFCIALESEDCQITVAQMIDYFADRAGALSDVKVQTIEDFINFIISLPENVADVFVSSMALSLLYVVSLFERYLNIQTIQALIAFARLGDPSDDWETLCEECPSFWEHTFDLTVGVDSEFITVNRGTFVSGQGIRSIWTDAGEPGEFQQWVTITIDFDPSTVNSFDRVGILSGTSIGSPEDELDYIYRIGTTNTTVRVSHAAGAFDVNSVIELGDINRLTVYVIGRAAINPSTTYNYLSSVTLYGEGVNPFV